MQLYLFILSLFISTPSISADYLPYKIIPGPYSMKFPIFDNINLNEAVTKINTHLQMAELSQLARVKNKSIYNRVCPNTHDYKKVGMYLEVKSNTPKILSLRFDIQYSWLTMAYWSSFYNFNPQNGDLIQLTDLFTEEGYKKFKRKVFKTRRSDFSSFFNDSIPEYLDDIIDCYERSNLSDFYVQNNAIYIESMNCFSKGQMFHGANTLYKFNLASFQDDLNDYGLVLFGLKENEAHYHNYMATSLPALFKGTIRGKEITLLLGCKSVYSNAIQGQYLYNKYGKCMLLKGELDGDYIQLNETQLTTNEHTGNIIANLTTNNITGVWSGNSSSSYPILLERY